MRARPVRTLQTVLAVRKPGPTAEDRRAGQRIAGIPGLRRVRRLTLISLESPFSPASLPRACSQVIFARGWNRTQIDAIQGNSRVPSQAVAGVKLEVTLTKNPEMVRHVGRNDEGERANGEWIVAGDTSAHPGVRREVPEKRDGRLAHALELLHMCGPTDSVGLGTSRCDVLVEAGKRRFKAAGEPESAEDKGAFGVGHMIENLADAPLLRRIAKSGLLLRDSGK